MIPRRLLVAAGGSGSFPPSTLYALFNGSNSAGTSGIGAGSAEGGVWSHSTTPVLSPGSGGTWDDVIVGRPCLLWDGAQFVVYYDAYDGTNFRIGRATAPSWPPTFTKYGSNPVLNLGSGGAFDDTHVSFPTVLYEPADTGREWKLWYEGDPSASWGDGGAIGYAYSSDGISWTKHGQVLAKGSSGQWDDESVSPGAVINVGGTYYLFYGGRQGTTNPRWQGGLATFTDPEGTYTKSGSNPVMLARFNDGIQVRQDVQIDAASAIAEVEDSTEYSVGEPVTLHSSTEETEIHTIVSLDSATQVTLDAAALSDFHSPTDGAGIGPLAFNSIDPRTVRAISGGYEAYLAVFQPVADLSVGGDPLREASMRMTAPALTGPWTFDYDTGMLFPINVPGAMFAHDAENPSVIAAP